MTAESRFNRNELLFGAEGQTRIAATAVAIVGLGGLGSHVAQQLAYLGTQEYVLVDADRVSSSSLNRLIGAIPHDADDSTAKVGVAERLIRQIREDARIRSFDALIDDPVAYRAAVECDVLFGCLDEDPPRLRLVELSSQARRPYFDLATDVSEDGSAYGGRLLASIDGERCLSCMGLLDQEAIRRDAETEEQRAENDRIYGIRRGAMEAAGPSVVSINGVVASAAVTEFMVWVTGLRDPRRYLVYRAERGIITTPSDPPLERCPFCRR
jgi:molybdopterin/thiamine biosynthesis adenylyltransferase